MKPNKEIWSGEMTKGESFIFAAALNKEKPLSASHLEAMGFEEKFDKWVYNFDGEEFSFESNPTFKEIAYAIHLRAIDNHPANYGF